MHLFVNILVNLLTVDERRVTGILEYVIPVTED